MEERRLRFLNFMFHTRGIFEWDKHNLALTSSLPNRVVPGARPEYLTSVIISSIIFYSTSYQHDPFLTKARFLQRLFFNGIDEVMDRGMMNFDYGVCLHRKLTKGCNSACLLLQPSTFNASSAHFMSCLKRIKQGNQSWKR